MGSFEILYEDRDILVCNKPAGLAVQSARVSEPDLVSELKKYLSQSYLGVVHRLDQPVSGLLVFAKNKKAAAALSRQTAAHQLNKLYRAVVYAPQPFALPEQTLTDWLAKEPGGGGRITASSEPGARQARLTYRCLEQKEGCALLEIDLETGRHHQIRLQLAHAGLPLLGDQRYGTPESRELSQRLGVRRICLQAAALTFFHPTSGKKVSYELEDKIGLPQ
ncbi:MAG: RluA family pseudouridine synthase [Eubacteriales bacterium]|nr:RluA family pseudouridine synthase [Eubacteriales bacterium]